MVSAVIETEESYSAFLESKKIIVPNVGISVEESAVNPILFPFQRDLVRWSAQKGRAALFEDCGLGKTAQQLEWARLLDVETLILAPLTVAQQTVREGKKFGISVQYCRDQRDVQSKIVVTNYEMLKHFDTSQFGGVVLDESSILKSFDGKMRTRLIEAFKDTPYRLCCTATPAPNDIAEIANHAEFLGIMTRVEMLATFFVHDDEGWRLRGHAREPFFRWLASWAMALKKPSDLGYSDDGFDLPPLEIRSEIVHTSYKPDDQLFFTGLKGIQDRTKVRQDTVEQRIASCLSIVNAKTLTYNNWYELTIKRCQETKSSRVGNGPSRTAKCAGEGASTQSESGKEISACRIHETIPPCASGKVEKDEGATKQGQCTEKGAVCVASRPAGVLPEEFEGMEPKEPGETQSTKVEAPRNNSGRISFTNEKTREQVCNLRICESGQAQDIPCGRPLPSNGEDSWPSMHQLQSSNWETSGRSSAITQCDQLPQEKWLIWCGLNSEQEMLEKALGPLCVSIYGSLSPEEKVKRELEWREGAIPVLLTKPSVMGYGMNWQHCHRMIFVGIGDSYEQYYQAIRRCWRFGQKNPVEAVIVLSDVEEEVLANVRRKEQEAEQMTTEIVANVAEFERAEIGKANVSTFEYREDDVHGENWHLMLGDSTTRLREIEANSVGLSVYSPPFLSLYTYSATERDLGNSTEAQFWPHFRMIIRELLRATMPGRNTCCHVAQVPALLAKDGYIGIKDFRGDTIKAFEAEGWIYHGEVVIDKDPQAQAIRTHSKSLLFTQLRKDASWMRPALADYILVFRKPGDNPDPISPDISNDEWIEWARPIWYGIRESDTLNIAEARSSEDDRHICPLQLGTIERCIRLWSNPGDLVLSPFTGIGSEGHEAVRLGRRFVGCELKPEYFRVAVKNLRKVEQQSKVVDLFSFTEHSGA